MAAVKFEVSRRIAAPPRRVWDELIDWHGHGEWIPATWIETDGVIVPLIQTRLRY